MELKDIKGYRSPSINALNKAVTRHRIVGGDVTPIESDGGTTLHFQGAYSSARFELFNGTAEVNDNGIESTLCVSDGALYVNFRLKKLKNATNTLYKTSGISPRGRGWASKGCQSASSWGTCEAVVLKHGADYYMAFRYDGEPLYALVSADADESIESEIEVVCVFGSFQFETNGITQNVKSDIFITDENNDATIQPWQVFKKGDMWYIARPAWTLAHQKVVASAPDPLPKSLQFTKITTFPHETIDGTDCYKLDNVASGVTPQARSLYACFNFNGMVELRWMAEDSSRKPNRVLLGKATLDDEGKIKEFSQSNQGEFYSIWNETEPFFLINQTGIGNRREIEAPKGLAEGTTANQSRFWKLKTQIKESTYAESEDLNYSDDAGFPAEQPASFYGSYIWRYNLHFRQSDKALLVDTETTAVPNVPADIYATETTQPFVERIEVTYPDTPYSQGSVDAVGGEIRVLMVGQKTEGSTNLFKTETIDTTTGNLIEGV